MTKPKRIVLLVVEIVTALGGLAALTVAVFFMFLRGDVLPSMPSHQEIYAASEAKLRTELKLAVDNVSSLSSIVQEWGGLLLFCGSVMFVGSILRLILTPWRLSRGDR